MEKEKSKTGIRLIRSVAHLVSINEGDVKVEKIDPFSSSSEAQPEHR